MTNIVRNLLSKYKMANINPSNPLNNSGNGNPCPAPQQLAGAPKNMKGRPLKKKVRMCQDAPIPRKNKFSRR